MQQRKKINRKSVSLVNSNLHEKRLISKYNKFQRWVAKIIRVELADTYQYMFRIQYKGNARLQQGDAVVNTQGVIFAVALESNRLAMIVTLDSYKEKPKVYGKLEIIEKSLDEVAKDKQKERKLKAIK